jgi:outer membrane protein assembly factor BamB
MQAVGRVYTKRDADGYRLPTTDEFREARLAGARGRYSWGSDPTGVFGRAWLLDNSEGGTHPVATARPNAAGLYDMEGNVSELCTGSNPSWDLVSGVGQAYRCGGSFLELIVGVGRSTPPRTPAGWGYPDVGFRVVREASARARGRDGAVRRLMFMAADAPAKVAVQPEDFDPLQGRVHRGNLHRTGVFQAQGLSSVTGVKWAFRTGGPVRSSPVVTGGTAYVGSNDGCVYAIDARTGEQKWRYRTRGPVAGSAAVVEGTVYIVSEDAHLYALDAGTGEPRWQMRLSGRFRPCCSPAVAYGAVFVAAGATGGHDRGTMSAGPILAIEAAGGRAIWTGPRGPQGYAAICLDATRLYAGSNASNYQAVELSTGRGLWSRDAGHQNRQWTSMTRYGKYVYGPGAMTGTVQAWDPESGREVWQEPVWPGQKHPLNNQGEPGHEVLADLAVADGLVIAACNDGAVQSLDAQTGKRGWRRAFDTPIHSSPAIAGSTVYFGGWDGHVRALDLQSGRDVWRYKPSKLPAPDRTVGPKEPSARIISAPWVGDGVLYVGCDDGFVYAVEGPTP